MDDLAKQRRGKLDLEAYEPQAELRKALQYAKLAREGFRAQDISLLWDGSDIDANTFLMLGAIAANELHLADADPITELCRLSTFGARKYSLHPEAPHSWRTLPPTSFLCAISRHLSAALQDLPHEESIDSQCTSCAPEYFGSRYRGRHETAVLWNAIRGAYILNTQGTEA